MHDNQYQAPAWLAERIWLGRDPANDGTGQHIRGHPSPARLWKCGYRLFRGRENGELLRTRCRSLDSGRRAAATGDGNESTHRAGIFPAVTEGIQHAYWRAFDDDGCY